MEVNNAQRQYKEILEQKFEGVYRSPGKAPASAGDNLNLMKLEHEMKEIKDMLSQFAQNKAQNKGFAQMLQDLDDKENSMDSPNNDRDDLKGLIAREKAEVKEL